MKYIIYIRETCRKKSWKNKLKRAIAAGQYKLTGELVAYKGEIPKEVAEMVAEMCATRWQRCRRMASLLFQR